MEESQDRQRPVRRPRSLQERSRKSRERRGRGVAPTAGPSLYRTSPFRLLTSYRGGRDRRSVIAGVTEAPAAISIVLEILSRSGAIEHRYAGRVAICATHPIDRIDHGGTPRSSPTHDMQDDIGKPGQDCCIGNNHRRWTVNDDRVELRS